MGGMAALIPSKDADENAVVIEKVLSDKTLETQNGHDGTWIAHPGLADIANNVFSNAFEFDRTNQLHVLRENDVKSRRSARSMCRQFHRRMF